MKFPMLPSQQTTSDYIDIFQGYNHNERISENEFYDLLNLNLDHYPVLSSRKKRKKIEYLTAKGLPKGTTAKDVVGIADNGAGGLYKLVCKDNRLYLLTASNTVYDLGETEKFGLRRMAIMGDSVIIMPDAKYFSEGEAVAGNKNWDINASIKAKFTISLCDIDGEGFSYDRDDKAPTDPKDKDYWLDISEKPHLLKRWDASTESWLGVATTYLKVSTDTENAFLNFEEGDGIRFSRYGAGEDIEGSHVIQKKIDEKSIVVIGMIDSTLENQDFAISRKMPSLQYICESNNRLWGCGYSRDNTIYASKLGDFKNWEVFQGVSTDSYAMSIGTAGMFTGAISYMGYPTFFKKNEILQIYGAMPSQYQLQTTTCESVQKNNAVSIMSDKLIYKADSAVMLFGGSYPTKISNALGMQYFTDAIVASVNNKTYIAMSNIEGQSLFVYNAIHNSWHSEDFIPAEDIEERGIVEMVAAGEKVFIRRANVDTLEVIGEEGDEEFLWSATTGKLGMSMHNQKRLLRLNLRLSLAVGGRARVFVEYDSSGVWEQQLIVSGTKTDVFSVSVKPRRCDHFRIKIEGFGEFKLYSIEKKYSIGSDKK